jgi:hypothetical protein
MSSEQVPVFIPKEAQATPVRRVESNTEDDLNSITDSQDLSNPSSIGI